jgi:hypothetical protein
MGPMADLGAKWTLARGAGGAFKEPTSGKFHTRLAPRGIQTLGPSFLPSEDGAVCQYATASADRAATGRRATPVRCR